MIRIFWLALMVLWMSPLPIFAEDLRIATVELYPYGYRDEQEATGLYFELGDAIAREAGLDPVNALMPLARGMEGVASGSVDMIIMRPNKEISAQADNLGAFLSTDTVVIGRAQMPLRTLDDLKGKVVAFVRGTMNFDCIKRLGIDPFPLQRYEQGVKLLLVQRVDAIVGPRLELYAEAQRVGLPRRIFGQPLRICDNLDSVFLSKRVGADVAARVSAALERLRENGTLQRIVYKYGL